MVSKPAPSSPTVCHSLASLDFSLSSTRIGLSRWYLHVERFALKIGQTSWIGTCLCWLTFEIASLIVDKIINSSSLDCIYRI